MSFEVERGDGGRGVLRDPDWARLTCNEPYAQQDQ